MPERVGKFEACTYWPALDWIADPWVEWPTGRRIVASACFFEYMRRLHSYTQNVWLDGDHHMGPPARFKKGNDPSVYQFTCQACSAEVLIAVDFYPDAPIQTFGITGKCRRAHPGPRKEREISSWLDARFAALEKYRRLLASREPGMRILTADAIWCQREVPAEMPVYAGRIFREGE